MLKYGRGLEEKSAYWEGCRSWGEVVRVEWGCHRTWEGVCFVFDICLIVEIDRESIENDLA